MSTARGSLRRLLGSAAGAVPQEPLLALAGIAVAAALHAAGSGPPPISAELILAGFVPGLVFEAALGVDLLELRRVAVPVGLLATAGVVLTVLGIGAGVHLALGIGWPGSFALGAVLAATDPIAVVSLVRRAGAPPAVTALLEGESLLNDGTGVAVFTAVLATVAAGDASFGGFAIRLVVGTAGGAAVGAAIGALAVLLLRLDPPAPLKIAVTLAAAYAGYPAAEGLGFSGVIAVVVTGLVVARFGRLHDPLGGSVLRTWRRVALVLNAAVFVIIGLVVPAGAMAKMAIPIALAFGAMLAVRAPLVYGVLLRSDIPARWRHVAWWGGVRGAIAVALALGLQSAALVDPRVAPLGIGVVMLSLLVQAALMVPLVRAIALLR